MVVATLLARDMASQGKYEIIVKASLRFEIEFVLEGILWISFLHGSILLVLQLW